MARAETFQLSLESAEEYENQFVPAIFAEWARLLVDVAEVEPGRKILDVACGTGVVTRTAADRITARRADRKVDHSEAMTGVSTTIIGLDLNQAMLTVARRLRPDLDWRQGDIDQLPFAAGSFDVVLCQMALMFFPDPVRALGEMGRVTSSEGIVALVVPASLEDQPAYRLFVEIASGHAGPDARSLLGTYWACGQIEDLRSWCAAAGLDVLSLRTHLTTARFTCSDDLVATEIDGSPLAQRITPDVRERIRLDTSVALASFVTPDGRFEPPLAGHIVKARPRHPNPADAT